MATTVRNLRVSEAELAGLHEAWEELEDPRLESLLNKICDDPSLSTRASSSSGRSRRKRASS